MAFSPKIKLHLYGDSHLCDNHHFAHSMNEAISYISSWRFSEVGKENIHSYGGAVIDENLVEAFSRQVQKEEPCPQVHVFAIGGNNLRRGLRNGCPTESSEEVLNCFKNLVKRAGERENLHLVFCSLVPSPKHEPESKEVFWALNLNLKRIAAAKPSMASFLDLKLVAGPDHHAKRDLFSHDQIHLNIQGSLFMAKRLAQFLQHLHSSLVGIPTRNEIHQILIS